MTAAEASLYQSAADSLNNTANIVAQGKTNKKTREWNEKMYKLQREHALSDWRMQNEYNSPTAQMQRFRDAGLNPNLIYGQSNEGGVVRSTDVKSWNPQAPRSESIPVMDRYFNTQMKEAQINNLKAQNDNILAQKNYIDAQTLEVRKRMENYDSQIGLRQWQLDSGKSLFPANLEMQDWKVRHLAKDMDIKTQSHEYNLLKAAQSLEKGAVDIINSRIDTYLKRLDMAIKDGIITQQVYDRERTKAEISRTQASEMLLHQSRRNAERYGRDKDVDQWMQEIDRVTNMLRIFK